MNILITGAGGFLGKSVSRALSISGHTVYALCKPEKKDHLKYFADCNISVIQQDLTSLNTSKLPLNIDALMTLAQSSNFRDFPNQSSDIFSVNVNANLELLNWALDSSVKHIIHASSGGIYGNRNSENQDFFHETDQLETIQPLGFYLGSKLCSEIIFKNYSHLFQSMTILRPFFIYGPYQNEQMFIARIIKSIIDQKAITLQGENGLRVNPIYVEDAAAAFCAALNLSGLNVLNVAGTEVLSLRKISNIISNILSKPAQFTNLPGEPTDYIGDISLSIKKLSTPKTPFQDGVAQACAYLL